MIMNDEIGRMRKKVIIAHLKILS